MARGAGAECDRAPCTRSLSVSAAVDASIGSPTECRRDSEQALRVAAAGDSRGSRSPRGFSRAFGGSSLINESPGSASGQRDGAQPARADAASLRNAKDGSNWRLTQKMRADRFGLRGRRAARTTATALSMIAVGSGTSSGSRERMDVANLPKLDAQER